ncbi:MAG: TIGR01459 family HAD-type hydrolase [Alphaproteobacteria bacterium]|nr:TIGR01459 family HAD-type hydrolase [Alphaproteobacteria bacterium]
MAELAGAYDAAILDLWGVLHNGRQPYPGAVECLRRMRASGLRLVLLSNSPRRTAGVVDQLEAIGIPGPTYDALVTSGDLTHRALGRRAAPAAGLPYLYVGPDRDRAVMEGLPYREVDRLSEARLLVVTGPRDDERETAEDYADFLAQAAARNLELVCVNPDLAVMRGDRMITCAGALALAYERLGGPVTYFGKPHPPAYAACLELLPGIDRRRIIAIGDSLRTDIAGAAAQGIDSIFILGGMHAAELAGVRTADDPRLGAVLAAAAWRPAAVMTQLAW